MISGKAISRAVRGHFMVDSALNTMMVANAYNMPLPYKEEDDQTSDVEHDEPENQHSRGVSDLIEARQLIDDILDGKTSIDAVLESKAIDNIQAKLVEEKNSIHDLRTSKLWIQYMEMIDILRRFLKAEQTGNWMLHLQAVCDMLPFLAAAGHNHYTKSATIYLQMMDELQERHPDVYTMFIRGYHVIRRSDRYWAGLSTDLVIEQALM
jgi:hypothetical protein